ncbi:Uu.00g024640.m01.CDS01 [Anthostomella pinea]|uniref:Uu.00g024640.m01.CDS01 n=1 Tax=Anthostomella pinea TaxID=933095 RepID=A0AAI8YR56_9PEZI|nr:Uu.00g024640.m01.CDS01 [Anthostomella pinea]
MSRIISVSPMVATMQIGVHPPSRLFGSATDIEPIHKIHLRGDRKASSPAPSYTEDSANGREYEIEKLVDHRMADGDVLLDNPENFPVSEAEFSQLLCTAIQVTVVQIPAAWGVKSVVTVGHNSGEIAAAYAAFLVSAKEAIIVAYYRNKVVKDINTGGAIMAIGLGAEAVEPYLSDVAGKVVIYCLSQLAFWRQTER